MTYLVVKAVHVIAVISWMAGMLYLPRLMVYHADARPGGELADAFKTMERRLLRFIMTPAMILAWACGLWILTVEQPGLAGAPWMGVKLASALAMTGFHGYLATRVKRFANGDNDRSSAFYRKINEVPAVLMVIIVVMVIVRPF